MPDQIPLRLADRTAPVRQAVVVLGMHRSGTSALAGVIGKLGATVPRTLMSADNSNPRGYWESDVIHGIHTRLLIAMDSEWDGLAPLPTDWWLTDTARRFEDELARAVVREFGDAPLFVLKDPRLCRLLPLWKRVLDRVGAVPLYILPVRNPLEVANSLQLRDGFPHEKSQLIWLRHLLEAELETRGARRSFVAFAALLEDWPAAVRKMTSDLAIVWPCPPEACQAEVTEFLAAELRHHRIPDRTALESPTVPVWIRRAYAAAVSATSDTPGSVEATWNELQTELGDADRLLAPFLASLWKREKALSKELQAARDDTARRERVNEAAAARADSIIAALRRAEAEKEAARNQLEHRLRDTLAARDQRIAAYEVERATFGAQVGRWLTRRRAQWAPAESLRDRLVSMVVRGVRGVQGDAPTVSHAPAQTRIDRDAGRLVGSGLIRAPASDRVCDGVVLAFALWTICAHAVVASGGGLTALILLYALAVGGGLALRLGWVSSPPASAPGYLADPPGPFRPTVRVLPVAALAAGLAITLSFAWRPDGLRLWWSTVLLLGVVAGGVFWKDTPRISPPEPSRSSERLLWLLALGCVVLTLVAHRPDADDAFYVNVAVAAVDVPGQALLAVDTLHGIGGLPLHLPVYRVHSYELWNAALAYLTGIPAIYAFHWLSAAFAALLVPLAYAKLFRLLTPRWWLWSVGVLIVILVSAGETHRWYGNFAFVRMWQGKAVFLSVFLPLIYAYGLRFAGQPTVRDWTLLCAAQIAAIGCTSSALWAAPASAFLALACTLRPSRRSLKIAALGALGSLYVVGMGWLVRANLRDLGIFWSAPDGNPGARLHEALVITLGDSWLLLFGIGTLLVVWAVASAGLARRFAVICPLAMLVGLLNPYVADWLSASLTGPAYWRSMWALPLPILMTLVLTWPLRLGGDPSRTVLGRVLCLGLVVAFAILVPRYSALSATNGVELGWPKLKVPDAPYRWAATVNRSVPPGAQVAVPPSIDPWIVTFHHHAHPLLVRHYLWLRPGLIEPEDVRQRLLLQQALAAPELVDRAPRQFRESLERFQVRAVCLVNSPLGDTARAILGEAGFRRTIRADDYELWVRSDVGVTSPRTVTRRAPSPAGWAGEVAPALEAFRREPPMSPQAATGRRPFDRGRPIRPGAEPG